MKDFQMPRVLLAMAASSVCFVSAIAQTDLLPSTVLMREQSQALYRDLNTMAKGEAPYDKAKAEAALAKLKDTSSRIVAAFPESSKGKTSPNGRYSASPKVWDNKDDFAMRAANMAKAVNGAKAGTLDELKSSYPAMNDACNACHETFRQRKS